jgi:hypothetical protein
MTIHCQCDHCGASLKVKDKLAGTEGKCPKCHKEIHIPNASSDDSEDVILGDGSSQAQLVGPKKSAEEEEEDAIFGDDFFNLQEPAPRPRYVAPAITDDDDDDEPAPAKKRKSKVAEVAPAGENAADSGANAASIASSLLSKTGKRNRPEDFKDPRDEQDGGYDFSEIKYLLLNRALPALGAASILFSFFYWLSTGMMGGGLELPELAELTGRVTIDGQGATAQLIFIPKASSSNNGTSGSSSAAVSNPDGSYEAFYKEDIAGLVLGEHEVRINAGMVRAVREVTIQAGLQEINFELNE